MNKFIYILSLFVAFGIFTETSAQSKIYIDSSSVIIGNNGIFVKIDEYVFHTRSIFCDDNGAYLFDIDMKKCPNCDRDYPAYERECPYTEIHDDNNNNCNDND
jgi:hypothetical protein